MDFEPLLNKLSIRTKEPAVSPFRLNWAQKELVQVVNDRYNAGRPVRIVVLKARQLGLSTVTEGLMFWWAFVHDHSHGLVVAHEADGSEHLLSMTHLYWETFPFKQLYTPQYVSRKELSWKETGSSLKIATAGNKMVGRGRTINSLHGSEVAFWPYPQEMLRGLRQSIPNNKKSLIVLESTANGVGNYWHDLWYDAVAGQSEFEPLFFPWWKHDEYTGSAIGITGSSAKLTNMTEDERVLRRIGVTDDSIVWRRYAMKNLVSSTTYGMSAEESFMQEYPATPEEAFISSGTNVFPMESLKRNYDPKSGQRGFLRRVGNGVQFFPDISGPLTVYKTPGPDPVANRYFIGADPTHVKMGDNACAQVINSITYEQVAVWHGKIDPMSFAEELAKLGMYYNQAMICTEVEGPGYATVGRLIEMDYPNLWRNRWADHAKGKIAETMGWSTTHKRKEWAIGFLVKLLVDDDVTIHHPTTFDEMRNFVTLSNGGYGNAGSEGKAHDDTVMALAIACVCNSTEGPRLMYESAVADRDSQMETAGAPWSDWEDH